MKALKYICFLPFLLIMLGACSQTKKPSTSCTASDSLLRIGLSYLNSYHYYEDKTLLDTALWNFDKALNLCSNKKDEIYFQKAYTLYLSGLFEESTQQLLLINDSFLLPEYKSIIINQIKTKESNNDYQRLQYYQNITDTIISVLQRDKEKLKKIITADDPQDIWCGRHGILIYQMFHYRLLLNGQEQTLIEIDDMQVITKGNRDYFSSIKNYLMQPDSCRILIIPFMD